MRQILIALALGLLSCTVGAQDSSRKPSPDEMKQLMESSMGVMAPMMGKVTEVSIEAQLIAAAKPETASRIAQFKKNLYDALVRQGFSEERALTIVVNTPLPAGGSAK